MSYREEQAARLRADIASDEKAYTVDGVRFWKSNDAVIPTFVYKDAGVTPSAAQVAAYEADRDAFLDEYRKNPPPVTDEQRAEMRAAFGPGTEVVNVITGRKTRL